MNETTESVAGERKAMTPPLGGGDADLHGALLAALRVEGLHLHYMRGGGYWRTVYTLRGQVINPSVREACGTERCFVLKLRSVEADLAEQTRNRVS